MILKRAVAKIDLDAIEHNYLEIKQKLKKDIKIMGIIKADAYGHGAISIAKELVNLDIDMFGVATTMEAISLRKNGIKVPILILGYINPEDYFDLVDYDLIPTVYHEQIAIDLNEVAKQKNKTINIHLKVDTGMGRLGFCTTTQLENALKKIKNLSSIKIDGIFTHFSKADEKDQSYTELQIEKFHQFLEVLKKMDINPSFIHASNSAGIINHEQIGFTMVRAGIILYGCYPSEFVNHQEIKLKPALSLCSNVIFIKEVPAGQYISYGGTFQTTKPTKIATVSIGYGDGYPRFLSNKARVLVNGQYAKVIGKVCMDQMMIDVTDIKNVKIGDEVVLFGSQLNKQIEIEEIAALCQTINYEMMCQISPRVPRDYYKNGKYQFTIDYLDLFDLDK